MGFRLSKIVTRTGDDGETGLADGQRVPKDHHRIEAIGSVDELNSCLGVLVSLITSTALKDLLQAIQNQLFELGSELALPGKNFIFQHHVEHLEANLEKLNADLPPLKEFILPGGSQEAAWAHFSRCQCRTAERRIVSLHQKEPLSPALLAYINRLSDFFFVLARSCNKQAQVKDILWQRAT